MDIMTAWAVTNPAVARLLWVLLLVLATLLVWLFFFCCYSWNQSSSPSLERYLAVMVKQSKSKAPTQRKKKPKEKPAVCVQPEDAVVKEPVAPGPEPPSCPAVRKRKRRPLKVTMETVTAAGKQETMQEEKDKPKRRPLVRAASEESSSDLSSVSCSPFPGDTLPWNLPKHHRIKRSKSASGDVLDPAERAVIRIAVSRLRRTENPDHEPLWSELTVVKSAGGTGEDGNGNAVIEMGFV
ncbi:uncharacterized protein LOC111645588 [Seriola lalandi dorsalis]|uniref:uncharacterized protein LOC111645588 n=1 Tax=Seriola lalandi dorsalis TaxID=1841481 RepID=UPI000C6F4EBE|nr:uncharacterized protein LOC111645588 [Seriola lalandi dorsalis]